MATRRITQAERESATDAQAEFIPSDDANYDADTEEAIHHFRDALAGSENKGTLWVYRLPCDERGEVVANAKPASLFNSPVDRFELEELSARLRREYMSPGERGVFRLTITQRGSQGLKLNRLLILERERVDAPSSSSRESITELLRVMQESNQAAADRTERLLGALHVQRTPATDPMQQSLAIVAAITGLTQSLVRQSSGAAPAAGAVVDPMASIETTIRVMSRMRSFFGDSGGDGGGDPDGLAAILRAAGPIVSTIGELARRQPMLPAQATVAHRRRSARVASAPGVVAPSTTPEVEPMIAQLRPQFEALTAAAKDGGDPVAIAPLVLQAIPEGTPVEARFVEFLQRADWFATVVAVYAPARDHAQWFAKLRDAILAEFEADDTSG